ncbi:hypothetical protein GCM10010211_60990 [Streptomyces albospinus]|uniref:Integral membrane protein n=1 Tax=Streptomyces albospinus TaxID=285515 RepID=A0ABQ2VHZ9_9ACTN|nr:hypothetical protein [Streptomyces albospinus]GGU86689.1 hypothetical protein GCM10010211_60990 [Streptomyces albospinus]
MDQHSHGDQHSHQGPAHEALAARSHGTVEPEHGATALRQEGAGTVHRTPLSVALPVIAALGFGCYTIWLDHTSGASGGQAALRGLIAAVVSGALGVTLVHFGPTMITETRALAYAALFGTSMGWLYSVSGPSVLKSSGWGVVMFAVMFVVSLYAFRTHRVREPHGLHRPHTAHLPHTAH